MTLYHGDCLAILPTLERVDHVITDPPYGRDVYLRASAVYTHVGSGTPKRMGLSEQKRRGGALQKMASGDIGAIDEMIEPVGKILGRITRRWCVVFSDVESCDKWRAALSVGTGARYVRTWRMGQAGCDMPQGMSGDRP